MDVREKLVELLEEIPHPQRLYPDLYVDRIIAKGVTVQDVTDNNVGCKWIPVTERLPEPYTQVITLRTDYLSGDSLPVGLEYIRLHGDANIPVWSRDYATWKNKVTHWMTLPEPLKED